MTRGSPMRLTGLALIFAPWFAAQGGEPALPLETALNSVWGGHVHCMGPVALDWDDHWNLKYGKIRWTNKSGVQWDVAWNGSEFIITGMNGSYLIEGTGHFEGSTIVADFAYTIQTQCHGVLEIARRG